MIARITSLALFLTVAVPAAAETLSELMARMDRAAASFTGMTASLKQVEHTDILGENETQTGSVRLKRTGKEIVARVDFGAPNERVVGLRKRRVEVFVPKSNTVQIYDVGKFGQQIDQFLLLGFGTSGKDLQKNYTVTVVGPATVGDKKTTHVELIPKSKDALEYFKKAELWIATDSTFPVQEKIHKNAKDYILINYTDVKINAPLTDKELEVKLPAGVKKIDPNK